MEQRPFFVGALYIFCNNLIIGHFLWGSWELNSPHVLERTWALVCASDSDMELGSVRGMGRTTRVGWDSERVGCGSPWFSQSVFGICGRRSTRETTSQQIFNSIPVSQPGPARSTVGFRFGLRNMVAASLRLELCEVASFTPRRRGRAGEGGWDLFRPRGLALSDLGNGRGPTPDPHPTSGKLSVLKENPSMTNKSNRSSLLDGVDTPF